MRGRAGHARAGAAYAGFAVFGGFWGTWGASIPAIRDQAGITVGELGTALLFIGAGALPAMLLSGRIVDHWGQRAAAGLLLLLGFIGVLVASTARDLTSLSAGLAALGAASGAADVAINTAAGSAQQVSSRNVITRAHAIFSLGVVVASLLAGALHQLGAPLMAPFILLAGASAITAVTLAATAPRRVDLRHDVPRSPGLGQRRLSPVLAPLLVLGALGAVALAVENGHQSWSALYLQDALHAGPAVAAAGPAVFAAIVALTRLAASRLSGDHAAAVLLTGSVTAGAGTALVAAASTVPLGLLGFGIAAAGTAALFPTILGVLNARVPEHARGRANSIVTAVAYLGFLAGPVYMGGWAKRAHLAGAMFALAALAAALAPLTAIGLRIVAATWHGMDGDQVPNPGRQREVP